MYGLGACKTLLLGIEAREGARQGTSKLRTRMCRQQNPFDQYFYALLEHNNLGGWGGGWLDFTGRLVGKGYYWVMANPECSHKINN